MELPARRRRCRRPGRRRSKKKKKKKKKKKRKNVSRLTTCSRAGQREMPDLDGLSRL